MSASLEDIAKLYEQAISEAFKFTKASKEKKENEEKVGISGSELNPDSSFHDQSLIINNSDVWT